MMRTFTTYLIINMHDNKCLWQSVINDCVIFISADFYKMTKSISIVCECVCVCVCVCIVQGVCVCVCVKCVCVCVCVCF